MASKTWRTTGLQATYTGQTQSSSGSWPQTPLSVSTLPCIEQMETLPTLLHSTQNKGRQRNTHFQLIIKGTLTLLNGDMSMLCRFVS